MRRLVATVVVASALLEGVGVLVAQVFQGGIETVEVTMSVTDADGRQVGGLTRDDFEVFDDGDQQPITHFTSERVALSLGMLVDISDSMRGQPIVDARQGLAHFMGNLLQDGDEVFLGTFNHEPQPISAWTRPPRRLIGALDGRPPSGGTAIYDAVAEALPAFDRRSGGRAALVVISDGADTASDLSLRDTQERLRRTDAFVYAIAIDAESTQRRATRVSPEALQQITGPTGGYTEVVQSAADLPAATERLAVELNAQYTLGYAAPRSPDSRWHTIRVRALKPGLVTRSRRGYFATPVARRR